MIQVYLVSGVEGFKTLLPRKELSERKSFHEENTGTRMKGVGQENIGSRPFSLRAQPRVKEEDQLQTNIRRGRRE